MAFAVCAQMVLAAINPPTDFRTDPADFSDLDLPVGAIAYQFRWTDNASNETGYQVEVSRDGVNFQLEKTLPANALGYDNAIVPWTSNRWYRVRAVNGTEVSAYAGPILAHGYMPPAHLGGSTLDSTHMTVTWATAGGYIDGYTVQQDTTTNFSGANLRQYYVPGKNTASYQINFAFAPDTIYYFRVVSTNSAVGNGTSEALNKPIAYLACAPNGPPTPPVFVSEHMDNNPNEAIILFDKDSLNETSWSLEYTTNAGANWYSVPVPRTEGTRFTVIHSGLVGGIPYSYRLAALNASGASTYTIWTFTPPANPPPGNTVWYVDRAASGSSDGTSWANAWTSLGAINWSALRPGHVVYVAGGVYTNSLVTFADGAYGNPIVIKAATDAPHNSRVVIYGQVAWKSSYVTIDGARDDNYVLTRVEDVPQNINLEVIARQDASAGVFPYVCVGAVGKWMEIHNAGNPLSGEGEGDGLSVLPGYLGPTNSVFAYLWIHDNYGSIINQSRAAGYYGFAGVTFHHILGENCHNNFLMGEGSYDLHDCLLRDWKSPGIAHPDGIQGGISNVRMWNNRLQNSCPSGSTFYPDLNQDQANFAMVNNVFSGDQVNCQMALSSLPTTMTISNVVIAGNTFYGVSTVNMSVVNNGAPNRFLKAWKVENNLFYSGTNCSPAAGAFSTGGCMYSPGDMVFDHNIICGPAKLLYYRTNNSVAAGVNLFPNAEAFNAWSTTYKQNSSATPVVFSVVNNDFRLLGADTVARGGGANLSALTAQIPMIAYDCLGTPRPAGGAWDIGAYQYNPAYSTSNSEPGLVMWLTFENDFYSKTNKYAADASGNGRDGIRFGRPGSMTNYPTPVLSYDGSTAAEFHAYPKDLQNGQTQYFTGDYIAVTNLSGIRSLISMTAAAWVKYYDGANSANATIFSSGHNELGNWRMGRDGEARTMFTISPDGVSLIPDNKFLAFPDTGITNQWHHYAVTWDGLIHRAIAYFDGIPCATNEVDGRNVSALTFGPAYLGIGCWTFNEDPWILPVADGGLDSHPNNGWINGAMDDLRLYNRVLSASEIQAEFGGSAGPANFTLQLVANGNGTVSSSPSGINCGSACAGTFTAGTIVTLTAVPSAAALFAGWSGAISGTSLSSTITVTNNATVTATFTPRDVVPPTVEIAGPLAGATAAGSVQITATASDNYGVASVQYMIDGAALGPQLLSPPFALAWQTATVPNGLYSLTAVAIDTAGNSATSSPVAITVANSDLVLHFDFNQDFSGGVVPDLSGYANHGVGYNLDHWPGVAPGVEGQGAYFPGNVKPAYIAITNWNGIEILPRGAISIWARFTTNGYEGSTLIDAGDLGHPSSWRLGRSDSPNVRFLVVNSLGVAQVKVNFPNDSLYNGVNPTYATARWHHYAVTWDGTNIFGYYDRVPVATNSMGVSSLRIVAGGHWMAVGCRQRDGTPQWGDDAYPSTGWLGGSIDELRIYNRFLSSSEIATLYASQVPGRISPPTALKVAASPP